ATVEHLEADRGEEPGAGRAGVVEDLLAGAAAPVGLLTGPVARTRQRLLPWLGPGVLLGRLRVEDRAGIAGQVDEILAAVERDLGGAEVAGADDTEGRAVEVGREPVGDGACGDSHDNPPLADPQRVELPKPALLLLEPHVPDRLVGTGRTHRVGRIDLVRDAGLGLVGAVRPAGLVRGESTPSD